MLLDEGGPAARVPPGIGNVEVGGHGDEGVVGRPRGAAVLGLAASRVDALDAELGQLELVAEALAADADDGVEGHLHVGQLLWLLVEEVADNAA